MEKHEFASISLTVQNRVISLKFRPIRYLSNVLLAIFMSSLCDVYVRVRVNNFFSKTTRPRDMLFFLKDTLSIEDEKLFKACKSVCLLETLQGRYPHQKCENSNTLSQFSLDYCRNFSHILHICTRPELDSLV